MVRGFGSFDHGKIHCLLIVDQTDNDKVIYVGKGQARYGHRTGKSWGRIDVHRSEIKRAIEHPEGNVKPMYQILANLVQTGHQLDFRVVLDTDDELSATIMESTLIREHRDRNPDLLNTTAISSGSCVRRINRRTGLSPEQKQAISDRLRGKVRGPYRTELAALSPEERKAREKQLIKDRLKAIQEGAEFTGKTARLTPEQRKARRDRRAKVHAQIRDERDGEHPDESRLAQLAAQLDAIDVEYGLDPAEYKPKAYNPRPIPCFQVEQEAQFCRQFMGKSFRIKDVQARFQEQFQRPISVSGAWSLMQRNGLRSNRHLGAAPVPHPLITGDTEQGVGNQGNVCVESLQGALSSATWPRGNDDTTREDYFAALDAAVTTEHG